jgi:hypothetical protein
MITQRIVPFLKRRISLMLEYPYPIIGFIGGLALLIFAACGPATLIVPTITYEVKGSPTPSTTVTETTQPTYTPMPTEVAPSVTPLSTRTPTLPPTLTAPERIGKFRELLITNLGCRLPCWWGMTPGESLWTDANQFLTYLGSEKIYSETLETGATMHSPSGFNLEVMKENDGGGGEIYNDLIIVEKENLIERFHIEVIGWDNLSEFQSTWESVAE